MARRAIYGNCLHRLTQSPHHLEAQVLAKTHSLYVYDTPGSSLKVIIALALIPSFLTDCATIFLGTTKSKATGEGR